MAAIEEKNDRRPELILKIPDRPFVLVYMPINTEVIGNHLIHAKDKIVTTVKEHPVKTGVIIGLAVASPATLLALKTAGFSSTGVVALSKAAAAQSFFYGGQTGGFFAVLQSTSQAGISYIGYLVGSGTGGLIGKGAQLLSRSTTVESPTPPEKAPENATSDVIIELPAKKETEQKIAEIPLTKSQILSLFSSSPPQLRLFSRM